MRKKTLCGFWEQGGEIVKCINNLCCNP